jgi:phage-related protein
MDRALKERMRMLRVLERKARGERLFKEDFRKLEGDLYEFKDGDRRMIAFATREGWVLTHGFIKRSAKTPRREVERAQAIRKGAQSVKTYLEEQRQRHPLAYEQAKLCTEVSTALRCALQDSGLTQRALAERLGVSPGIVSRQLAGPRI